MSAVSVCFALPKRLLPVCGLSLLTLLAACPGETPSDDAGIDAGGDVDAGDDSDAGGEPEPRDAGEPEQDAGEPEPRDAGEPEPQDAGGEPEQDAGEPEPRDAGSEPDAPPGDESGEYDDPTDVDLPLNVVVDIQEEYDQDCYRFSTAVGGSLHAETSDGAGGCPGDTKISLYVGDGQTPSFENDDGGDGLCSLIQQDLPPGTYTVCAFGFSTRTPAGVHVDITLDEFICGDLSLDPGEECDADEGCDENCLVDDGLLRETESNDYPAAGGMLDLPLDETVRGHIRVADTDLWRIALPGRLRPGTLSLWLGGVDAESEECGDSSDLRMDLHNPSDLVNPIATSTDGARCRALTIIEVNDDVLFGDETFLLRVTSIGRPAPYTLHATYIEGICGNGVREPNEGCELHEANADTCDPVTCQPMVAPNDICYLAEVIDVTGNGLTASATGNTAIATDQVGFESCQSFTATSSDVDKDIFFTFTAPVAGRYAIEAEADFNHILGVSTTGCAPFATDACTSTGPASIEATEVDVAAGQQVFIAVDAFNGASGNVEVRVTRLVPPANETCMTAEVLSVLDDGSNVHVEAGTRVASNAHAYTGADACVDGNDVFYRFTAPSDGSVEAWARGDGYTPSVVVSDATCATDAACVESGIANFEVTAGQEVTLVVESPADSSGAFTLDVHYVVRPDNDVCLVATSLVTDDEPLVLDIDTVNALDDAAVSCASGSDEAPDVFYSLSFAEDVYLSVQGTATAHDFALALIDSCDGAETLCVESTAQEGGFASHVPAGDYILVVDGTGALERGALELTIQTTSFVPPADVCTATPALVGDMGRVVGDLTTYAHDLNSADFDPNCTSGFDSLGKDGVYRIHVPEGHNLTVRSAGIDTDTDTMLYLLDSCGGGGDCLAGADENTSAGAGEEVSWDNLGTAVDVFVVVDDWLPASPDPDDYKAGLFELEWVLTVLPADDAGVVDPDAGTPEDGGMTDAGMP